MMVSRSGGCTGVFEKTKLLNQANIMEEPLDVSYYLGGATAESLKTVDIVIGSGDIVTIDELPDDPLELTGFLEGENCVVKYWVLVLQVYAQANKASEAATIAKAGLGIASFSDKDKEVLHSVLGWIYMKMVADGVDKQVNLANAATEFAQLLDSESVNALLARALLHLYRDETDLALQTYDRLLKLDANNCLALMGKAQITLSKTHNYASALKLYQQVLVMNPLMKPDPRVGIGICFWFLKDRDMALGAWNRALQLDPANFKAKLLHNLATFDTVFTNSLSDKLFLEGYKLALTELTLLHLDRKLNPVILLALTSFYFSKGRLDLVEKIVESVVASFTNDISQGKSARLSLFTSKVLSLCSFWLGRVAYAKEDFTQSQRYFHEAIRLNESNLLAKLGLAQSQLSRNSVEEAIITFESIMKTDAKCLEVNYSLGILYSQLTSKTKREQAIQMLERYIRLSHNRGSAVANRKDAEAHLNKEPVALNAYLTLSKLYESKDIAQSLTYLHKAIESREQIDQDVPLEVYNNIGVLNFTKNNTSAALENFELALQKLDKVEADELQNDLKVSITFNLARTEELLNADKATEIYDKLLKECPHYFSAKLRLLFLDAISSGKTPKEEIEKEIKNLLTEHTSNLEVRSFYGWFIKTFGKKIGLKPDADTVHQKETLVDFDSHDCYALISLANIYCLMAKDPKVAKDEEKKKKYFVRAIELLTKVLTLDPKNVFAAQGLAIVYIENKEYNQGLDILRKIRDSLNDISVFLNLGHVLVELKQFSRAIECYEIASSRYANDQDPKVLGFLGRAWYLRAAAEKSLPYYQRALEYSEEALGKAKANKGALIFNVAFMQFQIAEYITKLPVEQRNVEDINEAIVNLNSAIGSLNELASEDEKHPPYPKAELKSRANLGTTTLLNRLNTCLEETKESVSQLNSKLEEAKKLREEEVAIRAQERDAQLAERKAREEEMAKERAILQEQAQQWAEESRANLIVNDDDDDGLFEEGAEKKKGKKANGKKKGRGKKKDFINDTDEEEASAPEEEEEEPNLPSGDEEESKPEVKKTKEKKPRKAAPKRKRRAIEVEEEDDDAQNGSAENGKRKKKNFKSEELVQDSSENEDGDLF